MRPAADGGRGVAFAPRCSAGVCPLNLTHLVPFLSVPIMPRLSICLSLAHSLALYALDRSPGAGSCTYPLA